MYIAHISNGQLSRLANLNKSSNNLLHYIFCFNCATPNISNDILKLENIQCNVINCQFEPLQWKHKL